MTFFYLRTGTSTNLSRFDKNVETTWRYGIHNLRTYVLLSRIPYRTINILLGEIIKGNYVTHTVRYGTVLYRTGGSRERVNCLKFLLFSL